ncbi:hypothetical protein ACLOJK_029077 [Asimina triloba]
MVKLEDSWNEKVEGRGRGDDAIITSGMLAEIMAESMRIFWEFLRADRDEAPSILKGFLSLQAELQDPSDSHLFASIQADVQKLLLETKTPPDSSTANHDFCDVPNILPEKVLVFEDEKVYLEGEESERLVEKCKLHSEEVSKASGRLFRSLPLLLSDRLETCGEGAKNVEDNK